MDTEELLDLIDAYSDARVRRAVSGPDFQKAVDDTYDAMVSYIEADTNGNYEAS